MRDWEGVKLFRDILRHRRISLGLSIYTEEQMIRVDPEQMSKTRNSILPEKKDPLAAPRNAKATKGKYPLT